MARDASRLRRVSGGIPPGQAPARTWYLWEREPDGENWTHDGTVKTARTRPEETPAAQWLTAVQHERFLADAGGDLVILPGKRP